MVRIDEIINSFYSGDSTYWNHNKRSIKTIMSCRLKSEYDSRIKIFELKSDLGLCFVYSKPPGFDFCRLLIDNIIFSFTFTDYPDDIMIEIF